MIEFSCKSCPFVQEYEEFNAPHKCPECDNSFYRLRFISRPKIKSNFANVAYKDTPRYSVSLGVSDAQFEEAKKRHPQAEWKKFGNSWRPLIKNRAEKKQIMRQARMEEYGPNDFD